MTDVFVGSGSKTAPISLRAEPFHQRLPVRRVDQTDADEADGVVRRGAVDAGPGLARVIARGGPHQVAVADDDAVGAGRHGPGEMLAGVFHGSVETADEIL